MSKDPRVAAEQLRRLSHIHADALDAASDADVLKEAEAIFGSVEAAVVGARAIIRDAIVAAGKRRLSHARESYDAYIKRPSAMVFSLPLERKKEILQSFAANDDAFRQKLTLAARRGQETESDLDGFLADLVELGVIDESGNKK